jgi:signal transduction histidine kinase
MSAGLSNRCTHRLRRNSSRGNAFGRKPGPCPQRRRQQDCGLLVAAGGLSIGELEVMRSEPEGTAERLTAGMEQCRIQHAERPDAESEPRHEQRLSLVSTFAGGLAHEFNNILVPLILYTEESLEELDPDHPVRANLERVLAAATRASKVVSKLLAFSRPVAPGQLGTIELASVTEEALDLCQALIPPILS